MGVIRTAMGKIELALPAAIAMKTETALAKVMAALRLTATTETMRSIPVHGISLATALTRTAMDETSCCRLIAKIETKMAMALVGAVWVPIVMTMTPTPLAKSMTPIAMVF